MADAKLRIIVEAQNKAQADLDKIKQQVRGIGAETDKTSTKTKGLGDSYKDLAGKLAAGTAIIYSGLKAIQQVYAVMSEGADIARMQDSSAALAKSMGSDMDAIVEAVKKASLGTVSDLDIMAAASRAMMLGIGSDADKLGNLMEIAAMRGRMMGIDATKAFSDMVTGIGRMSPMILDNLGITIDAEKTYSQFAKSIGKTAEQLTSAEKKQALLNRVLEEGNAMLAETGGLANDAAAGFERLEANWADLINNIKASLADRNLGGALNIVLFGNRDIQAAMQDQDKAIYQSSSNYEDYLEKIRKMRESVIKAGYTGGAYYEALFGSAEEWSKRGPGAGMGDLRAFEFSGIEGSVDALNDAAEAAQNYREALSAAEGAQRDFDSIQAEWQKGTGNEIADLFNGRLYEGGVRYREGLQAIDDVMGTTLVKELEHKEAVEELANLYAQTGDVEAFKDGMKALEDIELGDQKAELAAVKDEVQELYDYWAAFGKLPHEYTIKVNYVQPGNLFPNGSPGESNSFIIEQEVQQNKDLNGNGIIAAANGADFIVPPGYNNDSFQIGVTSGEHVQVTPKGKSNYTFRILNANFTLGANAVETDWLAQMRV